MADLHTGLRQEHIGQANKASVELVLARVISGRDQSTLGLHARPTAYTLSGMQMTDVLAVLGFKRSGCTFIGAGECYSRAVTEPFDLEPFADALPEIHAKLKNAERELGACGLTLPQPEGWSYFGYGRSSRREDALGDGHVGERVEQREKSSDDSFDYVLSWLVNGGRKGWTIHYAPRQRPLSAEVESAFGFLGLRRFDSCPEFDFDSCHWRSMTYREDAFEDFGNAELAISAFRAHPRSFAPGIEDILTADAIARRFGMGLLRRVAAVSDPRAPTLGVVPAPPGRANSDYRYDVALTFAGAERPLAEQLARLVRDGGASVFIDSFYKAQLWGKDLVEFFDGVYRKDSRFCAMFVSEEYRARMWTIVERRSAQARAVEERGREYILPIRVEDVELPGLPPTVGYLSLDEYPIEEIARILLEKIRSN
jgi:hypothetical protein